MSSTGGCCCCWCWWGESGCSGGLRAGALLAPLARGRYVRGWGSGGGCMVSPRPSVPPAHGHSPLPPPLQVNDTVMLDLETGKISSFVKFDVGNLAMVTGGHNNGRVGTILNKEKHKGSFDIVNIKDAGGCGVLGLMCVGGGRCGRVTGVESRR